MAKCVRKGKEVKRVGNEEAAELVRQGWSYCSKTEYRRLKKPEGVSQEAKGTR